jgi:uncharacterized protein (DUF2384 family)
MDANAIDAAPPPSGEWDTARDVLGDGLLGDLLGVSASSLRRYAIGLRPTPDVVAARLHVIVRVTSALAGAYDEHGIRRWFERPRSQLGGRRPRDVLTGEWSTDEDGPQAVVRVAELLLGPGPAF